MGEFIDMTGVQQKRQLVRLAESQLGMGNNTRALWYAKACLAGFATDPVRDYKVMQIIQ